MTAEKELSFQTQQTRAMIRKAALGLLNSRPSAEVTTHHIAEAAGISPGNLYYHYKNREAVIRDIFYEMDLYSKRSWIERGPENREESFVDFIRFFFGNLEKYRFFFRDFSMLLRNDPVLSKMWKQYNESLRETLSRTAQLWIDKGYMKKFAGKRDLEAFIDNSWILAHFSLGYLEASSSQSAKRAQSASVELFIRYLYPYHTEKGQQVLRLYLPEAAIA